MQKDSTYYQLKGYPGLTIMGNYIKQYIPKSMLYVEPFAGLGRTVELKHDKIILNDLSDYAINYLRGKYTTALITQEDYRVCIERWDSYETFFLIDPPWSINIYKNNSLPVCTENPIKTYDNLLNNILPKIMGSWILCTDVCEKDKNKRVQKSKFNNLVLYHPTRTLFGKPVGVRMASNKPFTKYNTHNSLDQFFNI